MKQVNILTCPACSQRCMLQYSPSKEGVLRWGYDWSCVNCYFECSNTHVEEVLRKRPLPAEDNIFPVKRRGVVIAFPFPNHRWRKKACSQTTLSS